MTVIGDLKHRVTFQEAVQTPDGAGGFAEEWRDVAGAVDIAAAVEALSAAEQLRFHQLQSTVTHRIHIRWREGIAPRMRILRGDEVYTVVSTLDRDGTRRFLQLMAALVE